MLGGLKEVEFGISRYPRALLAQLNKRNSFTLVESLVAAFILIVIITALFLVLNIGDLSNTVSGAKLELQQEVRRAMDWMVKDLRQTDRMRLLCIDSNGNPNQQFNSLADKEVFTDPVFPISTGYDGTSIIWSSNQIGYSFDAVNKKIIRSNTTQTWEFNNIFNLEFRKISLNLLHITISGETTARGNIRPTFNLEEEVKLRN